MNESRLRDYGIVIGHFPCGKNNVITDVPGVSVGHCTIDTRKLKNRRYCYYALPRKYISKKANCILLVMS